MKLLPTQYSKKIEAGTDEAGRGCLAGPVRANEGYTVVGIDDRVNSIKENLLAEVVSDLIDCDHVVKISAQ